MSDKIDKVIEITNNDDRQFQKAKLTWKIRNYEKRRAYSGAAREKTIQSDKFRVSIPTEDQGQGHLNFRMRLHWNHKRDEDEAAADANDGSDQSESEEEDKSKYLGLFLLFLPYSSSTPRATVSFDFSALLEDGQSWGQESSGKPHHLSGQRTAIGWYELYNKETMMQVEGLLDKEGALTLVCNLEILCNCQTKSDDIVPLYHPFCLSEELRMATETKDVTLICAYEDGPKGKKRRKEEEQESENKILCHKLILTTRSDVFKAMFSHSQTLESQNDTVTIEDTPMDVLQEFVDYLYTDKSESLASDNVKDIGAMLRLAEKYNVLSLKQRCEDRLFQLIKGSTLGDIYALAYVHNCEPVVKAAASYVADNFDEAFKFGWMSNFTQGMQDKIMKDIWALKLKASQK